MHGILFTLGLLRIRSASHGNEAIDPNEGGSLGSAGVAEPGKRERVPRRWGPHSGAIDFNPRSKHSGFVNRRDGR
jgi:hypothetical protein